MFMKVDKSKFKKFIMKIVDKCFFNNYYYTSYPQIKKSCNILNNNKIRHLNKSFSHIHEAYYNY